MKVQVFPDAPLTEASILFLPLGLPRISISMNQSEKIDELIFRSDLAKINLLEAEGIRFGAGKYSLKLTPEVDQCKKVVKKLWSDWKIRPQSVKRDFFRDGKTDKKLPYLAVRFEVGSQETAIHFFDGGAMRLFVFRPGHSEDVIMNLKEDQADLVVSMIKSGKEYSE